jgi:hypothetical protein
LTANDGSRRHCGGLEPAPLLAQGPAVAAWGRGNKNSVVYPIDEQDVQEKIRSSSIRDEPKRTRTGSNIQQEKYQHINEYKRDING